MGLFSKTRYFCSYLFLEFQKCFYSGTDPTVHNTVPSEDPYSEQRGPLVKTLFSNFVVYFQNLITGSKSMCSFNIASSLQKQYENVH